MSQIERFEQRDAPKQKRTAQNFDDLEPLELDRVDMVVDSFNKGNDSYPEPSTQAFFIIPDNDFGLQTGIFKVGNRYNDVFWAAFIGVILGVASILSVAHLHSLGNPADGILLITLCVLGCLGSLTSSVLIFLNRTRIIRDGQLINGMLTGATITRDEDNVMLGVRYRFTTPEGATLERDQWEYRNDLIQDGFNSSQVMCERVPSSERPCYVLYLDRHTFRML